MRYIIDANNFAGSLDLLGEKNFDELLISRLLEHPKHEFVLVFDSADLMGDKFNKEKITIHYTPRDNYYNSADDKLVEVIENELKYNHPSNFEVITNDLGLSKRIIKINPHIVIIKNEKIIDKLNREKTKEKETTKKQLPKKDINDINNELIKIWQ